MRNVKVDRRVLLFVPLVALAALGFLEGSAVGGQTAPRLSSPVLTATLVTTFKVTVTVSGPGSVTSSPAGINCASGAMCSASFVVGTSVVLTATRSSILSLFAGWSGSCTGTSTCTVSSAATVTASFGLNPIATKPVTVVAQSYTVGVSVSGPGTVTSSPAGISCGATCSAPFANGTSVVLTATPTAGNTFAGWGGSCTSTTTSTCTVSSAATVSATFKSTSAGTTSTTTATTVTTTTTTTTTTSQPVIMTGPAPPTPPPPPPLTDLAVAVSGSGTVTGAQISCGGTSSKCFGHFKPGTSVTLHAGAAEGFRFTGWGGGCTGAAPSCVVKLARASTVSAVFEPAPGANAVPVSIRQAAFDVHWSRSVGSGRLVVAGRIGRPAKVDVKLSRAGSGALLTEHASLPAGPFSLTLKLGPGLLPGAFVVTLGGRSGSLVVPTQVNTVSLKAPREGVVARAFASTSEGGGPVAVIHASSDHAYVHFVFAAEPSGGAALSVAWYQPDGKLLGVAQKPTSPDVTSAISSGSPLPKGTWRVDLRAGPTVVKSLAVEVR